MGEPRLAATDEVVRRLGGAFELSPYPGGPVEGPVLCTPEEASALAGERTDEGFVVSLGTSEAADLSLPENPGPDSLEVVRKMHRMRKELAEAGRRVNQLQQQLMQTDKMASLGQLAAGVAHEINNPIGFINSNLNTLDDYVRDLVSYVKWCRTTQEGVQGGNLTVEQALTEADAKAHEFDIDYLLKDISSLISESVEGTSRVKDIVLNLRNFARLDSGEWSDCDVNEAMESTFNIVWNELKYKCEVVKEYGELPLVHCQVQKIKQVFLNLLVNAAQAIPEKGDVKIRTWAENGNVCISVKDTGVGIPEEVLPKIFDPFFTTKEPGKGTGLGLSIAYSIIKQHGGAIYVDSEQGTGTTFTVVLPVRGVSDE